jgi:parvulin-like peptidyl-prolyl isomerase
MSLLVNNQPVDEELIRTHARTFKEELKREGNLNEGLEMEMRAREWARENIIRRTIVEQAAAPRQPEALLDEVAASVPRPKPREVADHYKQFRDLFYAPELIHAAHIVKNVDEFSTAEQALAAMTQIELELKGGADFGELADRASDCPGQGGDLDFFARGEMVDEFESAVLAVRPGEVTNIFRSAFGFHIAKLIEHRPSGLRPLNEVRNQIEEQLWHEKRQTAVTRFVDKLRAQAVITNA